LRLQPSGHRRPESDSPYAKAHADDFDPYAYAHADAVADASDPYANGDRNTGT